LDLPQRSLLFHLRMSGDLHVNSNDGENPHDRFVLYLEPDLRLAFTDPRKFGRIWLVSDPELFLSVLGPEPLTPDFTSDGLYQGLKSRRRRIKPLLMDQTFLAGLGNIYTDEALFLAGIHPLTPANLVTERQAHHLWKVIRAVLNEAIERNGASIDWMYQGGDFQNDFRVYQRNGEPCLKCGTAIIRLRVNQRNTHICPQCQPAPA
jgi:formamidopyrimidine-DNA glycosylase